MVRPVGGNLNCQGGGMKLSSFQPPEKVFKKYLNKINVEKYEGPPLPIAAANRLIEGNRKVDAARYHVH